MIIATVQASPSPHVMYGVYAHGLVRKKMTINGQPALWSAPDTLVVLGRSHLFTVEVSPPPSAVMGDAIAVEIAKSWLGQETAKGASQQTG